eukprot:TRINITY_DN718_c0_g1_i2.p1 TRINITY_DN718_c0_g1~~TRINITY_DN718_c0_g1_i2.p1  ORF type:complete len:473 (-),score=95.31 TRINITY_DN718_c0_g1_i2:63-1481(-)
MNLEYTYKLIERHEFELLLEIGKGAFSTVFRGKCWGNDVAIKVQRLICDIQKQEELFNEIKIISENNSPHIVLYMGICFYKNKCFIVSELMECNLSQVLGSNVPISDFEKLNFAIDFAKGLSWLHNSEPKIIHRDLKPENLLFDKNKRLKIGDFGLSKIYYEGTSTAGERKGTKLYMAPEVMQYQEYNEKCDIYSFSIILWQIFSRILPFNSYVDRGDIDIFIRDIVFSYVRPEINSNWPNKIKKILIQGWHRNSQNRPSAEAIVINLQKCLVKTTLVDIDAYAIWLQFNLENQVDFIQFLGIFGNYLKPNSNIDIEQFQQKKSVRAFEMMAVENDNFNKKIIKLQSFGKLLAWFRHLPNFLSQIRNIASNNWFFGFLSTEEATIKLTNRGLFLVRFSTSNLGSFTISFNNNNKIQHKRINRNDDETYTYDIYTTNNLKEIVEYIQQTNHLQVCPGWPFQSIFRGILTSSYD